MGLDAKWQSSHTEPRFRENTELGRPTAEIRVRFEREANLFSQNNTGVFNRRCRPHTFGHSHNFSRHLSRLR